jgi:hypothetical protein
MVKAHGLKPMENNFLAFVYRLAAKSLSNLLLQSRILENGTSRQKLVCLLVIAYTLATRGEMSTLFGTWTNLSTLICRNFLRILTKS